VQIYKKKTIYASIYTIFLLFPSIYTAIFGYFRKKQYLCARFCIMWIILAFISAFCLGCYDISKKAALRTHRVIDVLTGSVCISAVILSVPLLLSVLCPEVMEDTLFYVPPMDRKGHLLTVLKSLIVLSSWAFAYVSLKHLPISVVSPLQATRPMWTLIGAMLIFGERLNGWQWTGVLLALGTVLLFSLYSRKVSADTPKNASIHHSINRAPADFNLGEEEELRQLYKLRSNAVIDLQFRRSERFNPSFFQQPPSFLVFQGNAIARPLFVPSAVCETACVTHHHSASTPLSTPKAASQAAFGILSLNGENRYPPIIIGSLPLGIWISFVPFPLFWIVPPGLPAKTTVLGINCIVSTLG
jgi:uncharacterized membrane protein